MVSEYLGPMPENTPVDPDRDYRTGLNSPTQAFYSWAARHEWLAVTGVLASVYLTGPLSAAWLVQGPDTKMTGVMGLAALSLSLWGNYKLASRFQINASGSAYSKEEIDGQFENHVSSHKAGHLDRKGMSLLEKYGTGSETQGRARRLFEQATALRQERKQGVPNLLPDDPVYSPDFVSSQAASRTARI